MTSVIVSGARTPMGRLLGNLKDLPATALGAAAVRAALARGGVEPDRVQYVIMGQVLQAGAGQIPARQAAVGAGIDMSVPALTVNKVCLSGLTAIALADQLIRAGECDVVVAGGMESMTNAPHLLLGQRKGYKYGDVVVKDHLALDGLTDVWDQCSMGESTERHGVGLGISRAEQDAYAATSHQRAAAAQKNGAFAEEITPVEVRGALSGAGAIPRGGSGGDGLGVAELAEDEGVRPDATPESLGKLRPAFGAAREPNQRHGTPDGTITAGTASPLSDGAAAVLVMRRETAQRQGLGALAEIGAHGNVAGPDSSLHAQPANAIRQALDKQGLTPADLDLVEINEAFAQVVIASTRQLAVDPAIVNVNGGAIALGHPIGMSGARLALTLALELRRRGGGLGVAGLCGGGGQGDALVLRVPAP